MTTASPPSSPASQTTQGASSNIEYDTPDGATAAAATTTEVVQTPPSTEDTHEDECVLCYYPLPIHVNEKTYKSCCGETRKSYLKFLK